MNTDDYIRIQFKEHGRTRAGADCWGLVCIVYAEQLQIELPALTDYGNTKDYVSMSRIIKSESVSWEFIDPGRERPYDIAVFRMLGQPSHVGVVTKRGTMLHCERGSGVYLTDYYKEMQWDKRLEGFYRYARNPGISPTLPSAS